jgi:hypothetical protein
MSTLPRLTLLSLGVAAATAVAYAQDTGDTGMVIDNPGSIILVAQLNEAEDGDYYCVDAFGSTVEDGDGVQLHTCKDRPRPAEDMQFTVDAPGMGNINVTQADDLCIAMSRRPAVGVRLNLVACDEMDMRQQFISDELGQIHPASDTSLCWTAAETRMCGNPDCSNYKRSLTLQTCADQEERYIAFYIPGGSIGL